MPQRISRRELVRRTAIGAVALATPATLRAQTPTPPPPVSDEELLTVEKELAKPLNPDAKKLLKAAVENSKGNSIARKKYRLEDCSEVATVYPVQPREKVKP